MPAGGGDLEILAARVLACADSGRQIAPISDARAAFDLDVAYAVSARVAMARARRGEKPVGWKIGFSNRSIWDEYGVRAPIWGPMYDSTVACIEDASKPYSWSLGKLLEPRIEPEIVFRMGAAPSPEMDERALLDAIDGVAHGFEIVQSIFPAWRFKAPDTVAAFALHGAYRHGPFVPVAGAPQRAELFAALTSFEIVLSRDGDEIDRGQAAHVLGGPLSAMRHFVRGLEDDPLGRRLRPGDLVTTGTVTRAFPVRAGECWQTRVIGLPTPGLRVAFEA